MLVNYAMEVRKQGGGYMPIMPSSSLLALCGLVHRTTLCTGTLNLFGLLFYSCLVVLVARHSQPSWKGISTGIATFVELFAWRFQSNLFNTVLSKPNNEGKIMIIANFETHCFTCNISSMHISMQHASIHIVTECMILWS